MEWDFFGFRQWFVNLSRQRHEFVRFAGVSESEYKFVTKYRKISAYQRARLSILSDQFKQHKHPRVLRQPVPSADIEVSLLRSWRQACRDTHGDCCNDRNSTALSQNVNELQLVDVQAKCLVSRPSTTPYIACRMYGAECRC